MAGKIHINKPLSSASISANNGITNNAGTLQLGGSLIQNTAIGGAFGLSLSNAGASFAVGAAVSSRHKIYGANSITAPLDGTAAGLFQTVATPAANVTGTVNIYGGANTLDFNLATASVNTVSAVNIAGHLASLVLRNGAAQSTGVICASRATLNLFDAVNAADVRMYNAKAPEISGTGAAILNLYGMYIEAQKSASVTNAWGVYQAGANDLNYLAGKVGISALNTTGANLQIGSATAVITSTPTILDMGGSVADAVVSSKSKWKLYNDGTAINTYGIGISTGQFNFFKFSGGKYAFHFSDVEKFSIADGSVTLSTVKWLTGTGSPDGVIAAPVGSIYSRTDGGTGTAFYVKETGGSTNGGWVAK